MEILEIFKEDERFPDELKIIKKVPKKLYCMGNIELFKSNKISVIGTRSFSEYGKRMCLKFSKGLSLKGFTIVSGMAIGIDSFAHIGAIESGGNTIAVLPCGLKNIYPKENEGLFEKILDKNGLIITEYEPNIEADGNKFLERNRIISALGLGTLVIEGAYRSGTSVTANLTQKSGKPVFAIPANLDNTNSYITNKLIRDGGILVRNVVDILSEFPDLQLLENNKEYVEKESIIDKELEKVYNVITINPIHINDIVKLSYLTIDEVNYQLLMLELQGLIISLPGKNFRRR